MKKAIASISGIVVLLLLCSGVFSDIFKFVSWLFALQYSAPETSMAGEIAVRILTFLASFSLVGILFNALQLFDSKLMSFSYCIISTLLGFVFSYIVWSIEQYTFIIGIIFGSVVALAAPVFVIGLVARAKEKKSEKEKTNGLQQEHGDER